MARVKTSSLGQAETVSSRIIFQPVGSRFFLDFLIQKVKASWAFRLNSQACPLRNIIGPKIFSQSQKIIAFGIIVNRIGFAIFVIYKLILSRGKFAGQASGEADCPG
jgi:hypothetical protein